MEGTNQEKTRRPKLKDELCHRTTESDTRRWESKVTLPPRDPISQTHHDRTSKAKITTKSAQNGTCTTCQEKRGMHVS